MFGYRVFPHLRCDLAERENFIQDFITSFVKKLILQQQQQRKENPVQRMKSLHLTIQMKAPKQYFPVVLFIMLYKVVLTFESVNEIPKCDHSNESY